MGKVSLNGARKMLAQESLKPAFWLFIIKKLSSGRLQLLRFLLGGLVIPTKLLLELLHATHGVNEFLLAGEVGMRRAGNVNVNHGIFVAIFPLNRLFRRHGRSCQKFEVGLLVDENDRSVVRMDIAFHCQILTDVADRLQRGC